MQSRDRKFFNQRNLGASVKKKMSIERLYFLFIFLSFALFLGCAHPKYTAISSQDLAAPGSSKTKRSSLARFVPLPQPASMGNKLNPLSYTVELLNKRKNKELELYVREIESSHVTHQKSELPLCKGLHAFFTADYALAIKYLEEVKISEHRCLVMLLIADCHYELRNTRSDHFGGTLINQEVLDKYQGAFDCMEDGWWHLLLKNRIKLIRYNY